MQQPEQSHEETGGYWKAMYEDQLRRKRLLHERYDRLNRAARDLLDAGLVKDHITLDRLRREVDRAEL